MKKKFLKVFALIFGAGLVLTGCGTALDSIKDKDGKNISYDTPAYYQGQVAKVGDYLFYGNSYADITAEDFGYKKSAKTGYLSRLDLSDLEFDDDITDENIKHSSPEDIEKVSSKLAGYKNQEMYVYGQYLYFTSANTHKTNTMQNDYSRVSLFRVRFNGEDMEELDTFTYDDKSSISLRQGSDGKYYFVIVCPTSANAEENKTYNIYSIKIGKECGKTTTLATKVDSAVVADENSSNKDVIYSYTTEAGLNAVDSVNFATGDVVSYDEGNVGATLSLIGRDGDVVFYSYTANASTEIFYKNVASASTFAPADTQLFYSSASIANIIKVKDGYAFVGAGALMYKTLSQTNATMLVSTSEFTNVLFAEDDYVYLSNESSIMRKSVVDGEVEKIVTEMTIISGECGYADGYIYFYAKRGSLVLEEGQTQEADERYYLYQTDHEGNVQLIGKVA